MRVTVVTRLRPLAVALGLAGLLVAGTPSVSQGSDTGPEEGPATVVSSVPGDGAGTLLAYARLMALPSIDTGARPRSSAPLYTGADDCPPPRCLDTRVPAPKGVKVSSNRVRVLLPTRYFAPRNRERRYPVVFLWNGALSGPDSWTLKSELLQSSARWNAIFVMPAGGKGRRAGYFSDWADGSADWETWHTQVVVPWADATFRTIPGARGSAGASMGAIGALNYATRHPGMFRSVLSISGALDTTGLVTEALLGQQPGTPKPDMTRVWGDPVLDKANWDAHNPTLHVGELRDVNLFMTSGTGYSGDGDGTVYTGQFERDLWNSQRSFFYQLTTQDVPYRARVTLGGCHNWLYFDGGLRWAMPRLIRSLLPS